MKNFLNYLAESEEAATNPVAGDTFAINIREECLIESVVVESRADGVVIAADEGMMQLLESYGYTFEQNCMECGMMECGCSNPEQSRDAEDPDPGEYDQEGDMAKNELLTMIRSARRLIGMLDNDDNMPEWTQKKITKATDYVDTAADYISSQKERGIMDQGVAEGSSTNAEVTKRAKAAAQKAGKTFNTDVEYRLWYAITTQANAATRKADKKQGVAEGQLDGTAKPDSPAARAILHRILMQHTGLLASHGPKKVMNAVDEVADYIGDVEEIGSSDVSGWVRHVEQMLTNMPDELDEQGVAEGDIDEAEYQGRKVQLGKPMQGDVAKSKVYVKDPKTGNVKKVNFGDPNMKIRKSNPGARKSFRARHNCDNPGPRTKARYWSCRAW